MKRLIPALLLAAASVAAATPAQATDVGVSISIGDPRYYGRIDIGNLPAPVVINPQPVIVQSAPVIYEPVYVRVPEGHRKHWSKHCYKYGACGRPVYFVQDHWYRDVYGPRYVREHRHDQRWDRNDRWDRDDRREHRHH